MMRGMRTKHNRHELMCALEGGGWKMERGGIDIMARIGREARLRAPARNARHRAGSCGAARLRRRLPRKGASHLRGAALPEAAPGSIRVARPSPKRLFARQRQVMKRRGEVLSWRRTYSCRLLVFREKQVLQEQRGRGSSVKQTLCAPYHRAKSAEEASISSTGCLSAIVSYKVHLVGMKCSQPNGHATVESPLLAVLRPRSLSRLRPPTCALPP